MMPPEREIPPPRELRELAARVFPHQVLLTFATDADAALFRKWLNDTGELGGWPAFGNYADSQP